MKEHNQNANADLLFAQTNSKSKQNADSPDQARKNQNASWIKALTKPTKKESNIHQNLRSGSGTDSKESMATNSEKKRSQERVLDALRRAAACSPTYQNLPAKIVMNRGKIHRLYEQRFQMLEPSSSSAVTDMGLPANGETLQLNGEQDPSLTQQKASESVDIQRPGQCVEQQQERLESPRRENETPQQGADLIKTLRREKNTAAVKEPSDALGQEQSKKPSDGAGGKGGKSTALLVDGSSTSNEDGYLLHGRQSAQSREQLADSPQIPPNQHGPRDRPSCNSAAKANQIRPNEQVGKKLLQSEQKAQLIKSDTVKTEYLRNQGSSKVILPPSSEMTPQRSKQTTNKRRTPNLPSDQIDLNFKARLESARSNVAGCQADEQELDRMAEDEEKDIDLLEQIRAGAICPHQIPGIQPGDQAGEAGRTLQSRGRLPGTNLSLTARQDRDGARMSNGLPSPSILYTEDVLYDQFQKMRQQHLLQGDQFPPISTRMRSRESAKQQKIASAKERMKKYQLLQKANKPHKPDNLYLDKKVKKEMPPKNNENEMTFDEFTRYTEIGYELERRERKRSKKAEAEMAMSAAMARTKGVQAQMPRVSDEQTSSPRTTDQAATFRQIKIQINEPPLMPSQQFQLPELSPEQLEAADWDGSRPPEGIFYQQIQPKQIHLEVGDTQFQQKQAIQKQNMELLLHKKNAAELRPCNQKNAPNQNQQPQDSARAREVQQDLGKSGEAYPLYNITMPQPIQEYMNPGIAQVNTYGHGSPPGQDRSSEINPVFQETGGANMPQQYELVQRDQDLFENIANFSDSYGPPRRQEAVSLDSLRPQPQQSTGYKISGLPLENNRVRRRRNSFNTRQLFKILQQTYMHKTQYNSFRNDKLSQRQRDVLLSKKQAYYKQSQKVLACRLQKETQALVNKDDYFDRKVPENLKTYRVGGGSLDRLRELQLVDDIRSQYPGAMCAVETQTLEPDKGAFGEQMLDARLPNQKKLYLCALKPSHWLKTYYGAQKYGDKLQKRVVDEHRSRKPRKDQVRKSQSLGNIRIKSMRKIKRYQSLEGPICLSGQKINFALTGAAKEASNGAINDAQEIALMPREAQIMEGCDPNYLLYRLKDLDRQINYQATVQEMLAKKVPYCSKQNSEQKYQDLSQNEYDKPMKARINHQVSIRDESPLNQQTADKEIVDDDPMDPMNVDDDAMEPISEDPVGSNVTEEAPFNNLIMIKTTNCKGGETKRNEEMDEKANSNLNKDISVFDGDNCVNDEKQSNADGIQLSDQTPGTQENSPAPTAQNRKLDLSSEQVRTQRINPDLTDSKVSPSSERDAYDPWTKAAGESKEFTTGGSSTGMFHPARHSRGSLYLMRMPTTQYLQQNFVRRIDITKSGLAHSGEEFEEDYDGGYLGQPIESQQIQREVRVKRRKSRKGGRSTYSMSIKKPQEIKPPQSIFMTQYDETMNEGSPKGIPNELAKQGLNTVLGIDSNKLNRELSNMKLNLNTYGNHKDPFNIKVDKDLKFKEQELKHNNRPEYSLGPAKDAREPLRNSIQQQVAASQGKKRLQTALLRNRQGRQQFIHSAQASQKNMKGSAQNLQSLSKGALMVTSSSSLHKPPAVQNIAPLSTRVPRRRQIELQDREQQQIHNIKQQLAQDIQSQIDKDISHGCLQETGDSLFASMNQFGAKKDIQHLSRFRAARTGGFFSSRNSDTKMIQQESPKIRYQKVEQQRASQCKAVESHRPKGLTALSSGLSRFSGQSTLDAICAVPESRVESAEQKQEDSQILMYSHDDFLKIQDQELFGNYINKSLGIKRKPQLAQEPIQQNKQSDNFSNFLQVKSFRQPKTKPIETNNEQTGQQRPNLASRQYKQRYNEPPPQYPALSTAPAVTGQGKPQVQREQKGPFVSSTRRRAGQSKQDLVIIPNLNFESTGGLTRRTAELNAPTSKQGTAALGDTLDNRPDGHAALLKFPRSGSHGEGAPTSSSGKRHGGQNFPVTTPRGGGFGPAGPGHLNDDLMVVGRGPRTAEDVKESDRGEQAHKDAASMTATGQQPAPAKTDSQGADSQAAKPLLTPTLPRNPQPKTAKPRDSSPFNNQTSSEYLDRQPADHTDNLDDSNASFQEIIPPIGQGV